MIKKSLIVVGFLFFISRPSHAIFGIGDIVLDPSNLVQNIAQVTQSMIQVQNQIKQIQNMIQNTASGASPWQSMLPLLMQLGNSLQRGQAIAYTMKGFDQRFLTTFPGYQSPKNWDQQYGAWTTTSLDTLRGLLSSAGVNADSLEWDAARLVLLHITSASAPGQKAALQAGNAIALESIGQLQRLEQIAMSQSNAYAVIEGRKVAEEAAKEAWTRQWLLSGQGPVPAYAPTERLRVPRP